MKVFFVIAALGALTCSLAGCGDEEREALFESQVCIDKIDVSGGDATSLNADVNACLQKISGQTSSDAYVLRCSGDFIRVGIAENKLVNAIQDLDKKTGSDPTATTMTNLSFGADAAAVAASNEAVTNCTLSKSTTLSALAGLANISTIMDSFTGGQTIDDFIANFDPNDANDMTDEEKVQLADSIITNQENLCDEKNGLVSDSEVCDNIDQAIESGGVSTEAQKQALIDEFMSNLNEGDN